MAIDNVMGSIRNGMHVRTDDGVSLGKVAHVWFGSDPQSRSQPCDEDQCSRLEVHFPYGGGACYIPYTAIADVSGKIVSLNLSEDEFNQKTWHRRPRWLPAEGESPVLDVLGKPNSYPGLF